MLSIRLVQIDVTKDRSIFRDLAAASRALGASKDSGEMRDAAELIDSLVAAKKARIHSEPKIAAVVGRSSSFKAGGQVPVRNSEDGQARHVDFGTEVEFVGHLMDNGKLRVKFMIDVSEIQDSSNDDGTAYLTRRSIRFEKKGLTLKSGETYLIQSVPILRRDPKDDDDGGRLMLRVCAVKAELVMAAESDAD